MRQSIWKESFAVLVAFVSSAALLAGQDIPLRNAPPPSLAEAARIISAARSGSGNVLSPEYHIVNPPALIFQTIIPCRLVDTRNSINAYGIPIFANAETRVYQPSAVSCGGSTLPDHVLAWYLNITVTGTTSGPSFLTAWQDGLTRPAVATVNWASAGAQVNNSVIVPAAANTAFDVYVGTSTHVIIDMTGFFIDDLSSRGDQFVIGTDLGGGAAILGVNSSNVNGSHGIGGYEGGTGTVFGVQGQISASAGADSAGVHGIAAGGAARSAGVLGDNPPAVSGAGVKGISGGIPVAADDVWSYAGVRGLGTNFGVLGISSSLGAAGFRHDGTTGAFQTGSYLGYSSTIGLHTIGNTSATGTKGFVEPHPTDPSKLIRYVAIEGPEAGTYFRGRGRFQNGNAVIEVPEHFRMVTDPEGLSVQVTPIGETASVAVLRVDLQTIALKASRNVDFFYTVNGVRRSFRDYDPIQENLEYRPLGPDSTMPLGFSPVQKQTLIDAGIYTADGKVNKETARALGWDKIWQQQMAGQSPQPNAHQ